MMELDLRARGRHPHRLRRVAPAAPAHVPGHHRPVPDLLCGQPVHLRHGPAAESGRHRSLQAPKPSIPALYADPLPQALVLTAIVISFAMTALFLVVLLASRGLTGTDHVDGREDTQ